MSPYPALLYSPEALSWMRRPLAGSVSSRMRRTTAAASCFLASSSSFVSMKISSVL